MKPHSLSSGMRVRDDSPAGIERRFHALGPFARRHGKFPKGTVLPETRILACPRVKMKEFPPGFIPPKYYEKNLEHNQLVESCCRHVEEHEIEAHKSHPEEELPDIYIIYCSECGRKHIRFLVGETDDVARPVWKAD